MILAQQGRRIEARRGNHVIGKRDFAMRKRDGVALPRCLR